MCIGKYCRTTERHYSFIFSNSNYYVELLLSPSKFSHVQIIELSITAEHDVYLYGIILYACAIDRNLQYRKTIQLIYVPILTYIRVCVHRLPSMFY